MDSTPSLDNKLTLSEEDAIRAQFMQCWSIPIGIPFDDTMIVKIKISLNTDGSLLEPPEVLQHERMNKPSEKYFRTLAESALRAVRRCDPIKAPDINRYESWKKIQLAVRFLLSVNPSTIIAMPAGPKPSYRTSS